MNLAASISTIMTTNVHTLSPSDSITKADKYFKEHNIHHIPIVEENKLVGILSKSDFLLFQRGYQVNNGLKELDTLRNDLFDVKSIMTTKIAKLLPEDRINTALEILKENIFHAIPIVDQDNELLGILSSYDIIKHLADEGQASTEYTYYN